MGGLTFWYSYWTEAFPFHILCSSDRSQWKEGSVPLSVCCIWGGKRNKCFLHARLVLPRLMNCAASERKSKEFWRTCNPSPSYVLIPRCCHKLRKINMCSECGPRLETWQRLNCCSSYGDKDAWWERGASGAGNVRIFISGRCLSHRRERADSLVMLRRFRLQGLRRKHLTRRKSCTTPMHDSWNLLDAQLWRR